jgi:hypothetical protein
MNCSGCGAQLIENAAFCTSCGNPVQAAASWGKSKLPHRIIASLCAIGLTIVTVGLFGGLGTVVFETFKSPAPTVTAAEVQTRLAQDVNLPKHLEALRTQFAHLNDEQWSESKTLIQGWVEELSRTPAAKNTTVEEIKSIAAMLPVDLRAQGLDAYYLLKKEKLRSVEGPLSSWFLQFVSGSSFFFSLLLIALFALNLLLLEIARTNVPRSMP